MDKTSLPETRAPVESYVGFSYVLPLTVTASSLLANVIPEMFLYVKPLP